MTYSHQKCEMVASCVLVLIEISCKISRSEIDKDKVNCNSELLLFFPILSAVTAECHKKEKKTAMCL